MKISGVRSVLLAAPGIILGGKEWERTATLMEIKTDGGVTGLGEPHIGIRFPKLVSPMVDFFRPYLDGKNPLQISKRCEEMRREARRWGNFGLPLIVLAGLKMPSGI